MCRLLIVGRCKHKDVVGVCLDGCLEAEIREKAWILVCHIHGGEVTHDRPCHARGVLHDKALRIGAHDKHGRRPSGHRICLDIVVDLALHGSDMLLVEIVPACDLAEDPRDALIVCKCRDLEEGDRDAGFAEGRLHSS